MSTRNKIAILLTLVTLFLVSDVIFYYLGKVRGEVDTLTTVCNKVNTRYNEVRGLNPPMVYPLKMKEGSVYGVLNVKLLLCDN